MSGPGFAAMARGARVEVTPYTQKYAFHYLAALDGKTGTVDSIDSHGAYLQIWVKLDSAIPFPIQALKPISDEQ